MPATLQQIYDFESVLQIAFKDALFTDVNIGARIQRTQGLNPKSSVFISVNSTGATGRHHFMAADGMEIDDQYAAEISLGIQTLRQPGAETVPELSEHTALKVELRAWMLRGWIKVSDSLAYHQIDRPPIPGSTDLEFEEDEYDRTILNYALLFSIRPDAWPVNV